MNFVSALLSTLGAVFRNGIVPPRPQISEYLATEGAGFLIDDGKIVYAMSFSIRKQLSMPLYATTSFQNPCNSRHPFTVESTVSPDLSEVFLVRSPRMNAIKNDTGYTVKVSLFGDPLRTKLLGTHRQRVLFKLPLKVAHSLKIRLL